MRYFSYICSMNKLKYNPDNPLSDKELDELPKNDFDMFLEYLDSKTEYLKSKTRPLNSHEMKKFENMKSFFNEGRTISDFELERSLKRLVKKTNKKLETNGKNYRNEQWW